MPGSHANRSESIELSRITETYLDAEDIERHGTVKLTIDGEIKRLRWKETRKISS